MPVDPNIALQYRAPQFEGPMQSIGQLMAVRGQTAEIALRQAQAAEQTQLAEQQRIKAEQDRRDLSDASTLQEAMGDPAIGPKIASGDLTPLYGKMQAKNLDTVRTAIIKQHQDAATADKTTLENRSTAYSALAEGLQGLGDDSNTINAHVTAFKTNPANQELFRNAGIDPNSIPTVNNADDLKKWEASVGVAQAVTNKALALKGVQTKQAEEEANAAKAQAEAEHQRSLNELLKNAGNYNPAAGGVHPVDAVLPASLDPQLNASYKAAFDTAMKQPPDQNGRRPAVDTVLEQAAAHAAALSPTLLANKARTAQAEASATAPIHQAESLAVAAANRAGAEHIGSEGEYQKSISKLNDSAADAIRLHNLVSAAQGGNKAAPGLVSIAELRGFLNRINSTELRSVSSSAGTWADRVQGFVNGATEGQPVPPEILNAVDELSTLQLQQAEQKHAGEVKSINVARHENFPAVKANDLGYHTTTAAPAGNIPTPASQAEYNALKKGDKFKKPNDPTVYTKQ